MSTVNMRLPLIEEDDREAYLTDYLEKVKKTSMVKQIIDEQTNENNVELSFDLITGIASKPL